MMCIYYIYYILIYICYVYKYIYYNNSNLFCGVDQAKQD